MFLKKAIKLPNSLAFRLTLWYALIFTLSALIAFFLFYLLISAVIRQNTDHELMARTRKYVSIQTINGINAARQVALREAQAAGEKKIFFRFVYQSGLAFSSSNMNYWKNIGINRLAIRRMTDSGKAVFETLSASNRKDKIRIIYSRMGQGILIQLGQAMENPWALIEVFQKRFLAAMLILVFLSTISGWFMAKRAIAGVETISRTARYIAKGHLEERVPVSRHGDEVDQLASAFNRMLDHIQILIKGSQEMGDNLAHDLKSPVTRIRGLAEITLTSKGSLKEYENMAANTIEECDRLLDMINTMLLLAQTKAGAGQLNLEKIDLVELIKRACDLFQITAESRQIKLDYSMPSEYMIQADTHLLQRMIANLLDNAFKYTSAKGNIRVLLNRSKGSLPGAVIIIKDSGSGIGQDDLPNIFKRFYRVDSSRSRSGSGLGLSLVQAIITTHGGDITVSSRLGHGSEFKVFLPDQGPA